MRGGEKKELSQKELGYLVGLYLGDGYAYYNKKDRHYTVEFYLNSERDTDIKIYVLGLLKIEGCNVFVRKDSRFNCVRIRIHSKRLYELFTKKTVDFYSKCPADKDNCLGLISGFIDAEGNVGNGNLVVTQKDKKTLEIFERICKNLGLDVRLWACKNNGGRGEIHRLRISTELKLLPHNSMKVKRHYKSII
jgi:hypothetical protein